MTGKTGAMCFVLHAHLPYVRHADDPHHLEEHWLYEALAETYLPLLMLLDGWRRRGLSRARLTLVVSPTLAAMLADALLRERFAAYAAGRIELAVREQSRLRSAPEYSRLAAMYEAHYRAVLRRFEAAGHDVLAAFARHAADGTVEIIPCPAAHPFAPLFAGQPNVLAPHLACARSQHVRTFGAAPRGSWLSECGYTPSVEPVLRRHGVEYTVLDAHALQFAAPPARVGPYAPAVTPHGLTVFGRDPVAARQVWSRDQGYPADPVYREFHLDLADVAPPGALGAAAHPAGWRLPTGLKYWRVGPRGERGKTAYSPEVGLAKAREHARHFVATARERAETVRRHADNSGPPVLVLPYDAELFGHWWFEGPAFLDAVMCEVANDDDVAASVGERDQPLRMATLADALAASAQRQVVEPTTSSWGLRGYGEMWINEDTDEYQARVLALGEDVLAYADSLRAVGRASSPSAPASTAPTPSALIARGEAQLVREMMLAQASDWPFLLRAGTHVTYAKQRLEEHLGSAAKLLSELRTGAVNEAYLGARERLMPGLWPDAAVDMYGPAAAE